MTPSEVNIMYEPIDEDEDGMCLVSPPARLHKLGLVCHGVLWKLKEALYGLRIAPKKVDANSCQNIGQCLGKQ